MSAPWMELAWAELGEAEVKGALSNPRIRAMFADAGHPEVISDEVPWCAAFVGAVLKRAGLQPTGSLAARSYLAWGEAIDGPRDGAVVVLKRTADPAMGHVGFCAGATAERVTVLGGNQGDRVSAQDFPRADVIGYRWPVQRQPQRPIEDAVVVGAPPSAPRPVADLLARSRTIRGSLWQALGATVLVLQSWVETLLAGLAEAARLAPLQALLGGAAKNSVAIGIGCAVWGTVVVVMRRLKDERRRG